MEVPESFSIFKVRNLNENSLRKKHNIAQILISIVMSLGKVECFHALVQIWSFECLEAFNEMSRRDSFDVEVEENESE